MSRTSTLHTTPTPRGDANEPHRRAGLRRARLAASAGFVLVLASCGGTDAGAAVTPRPTAESSSASVVLVDVRTPAEFAAGHLEGAINLSLEDGTLEARLAELDPNAEYDVYCRSGRRSAIAVDILRTAGFTRVDDLGGLEEAAEVVDRDIVTG